MKEHFQVDLVSHQPAVELLDRVAGREEFEVKALSVRLQPYLLEGSLAELNHSSHFDLVLCESSCFVEAHNAQVRALNSFFRLSAEDVVGFEPNEREGIDEVEVNGS